jgi:hypothetical protein
MYLKIKAVVAMPLLVFLLTVLTGCPSPNSADAAAGTTPVATTPVPSIPALVTATSIIAGVEKKVPAPTPQINLTVPAITSVVAPILTTESLSSYSVELPSPATITPDPTNSTDPLLESDCH